MTISVRIVSQDDESLLMNAADGVFDSQPDMQLTRQFIQDQHQHMAIAVEQRVVIGMASAIHYSHPDKAPAMWVNEVGVCKAFRRQGIARQLLACLFKHAKTLGCHEAWVATEIDNKAARGLYRKQQGVEESVVIYTFPLEN